MLRKALKVKTAIQMFLLVVNKDQLSRVPAWTDSQWDLLEKLLKVFGESAHTLDRLQGQKYVSQSSILLELLMIEKNNATVLAELEQERVTPNNTFIKEVIAEFKLALNVLWDKLPVDSIIATFLDPRVKVLDQIPKREHDEAVKTLGRDFQTLSKKQEERQNIADAPLKVQKNNLFKAFDLVDRGQRRPNQKQLFASEWDAYRVGIPCPGHQDPLEWWRRKEGEFPVLAELAKLHLGIPASQASCERLFSIMKNTVTDHRTNLESFLVEELLFVTWQKFLDEEKMKQG
jgi:hypothetical protein